MKRPAQSGERPWDTFKGSSVVNAPALYTMAYIHSFAHRCEWDENFVKGNCNNFVATNCSIFCVISVHLFSPFLVCPTIHVVLLVHY